MEIIDNVVKEIKNIQTNVNDKLKEEYENSEDVKEGRTTVEEEMKASDSVLFNAICSNMIKILEHEQIIKSFQLLSEDLSEKSIEGLINILAGAIAHSAYSSIILYDDLLKKEIDRQFREDHHHINLLKSEVEAHKALIQILKIQISELKNSFQVANLRQESGIPDIN